MTLPATSDFARLTEREKQALRLIVRGHDAKSVARHLNLSVHTVNERLREARRKLSVPSSREAARLLFAREGATPENPVPGEIGEAATATSRTTLIRPENGAGSRPRPAILIVGVFAMTLILGLLALAAQPQPAAPAAPAAQVDAAVEGAARRFLTLVDQGRWDDSYAAFGSAFRKLNTAATWARVSEEVRTPLGVVLERTLLSQENLPAPPQGYEVVKYRTRFANKAVAVETVTLEREGGAWRVVGVTIG